VQQTNAVCGRFVDSGSPIAASRHRTGNSPRLARRFVVRFGPPTRTTASLPFGGLTTIVTPCAAPPTIVVSVFATTPFAHGVPSTYSAALYVWAGRPTDDLPERNRAHSASASPQSAGGGSTRKIGSA